MNKVILLLINVLIVTLFACKNDPKAVVDPNRPQNFQAGDPATPTVLAGHWIDLDFCSRVGQYGSILQTMNNSHLPYVYALTFNPGNPDSVICYNAFETWTLPVKYKQDTLELMGAVQGKSVFLNYHSQGDKDMTMYDNTGGRTQMDHFIKSRAGTKDGYTAFTTALNHHLFNGIFTPVGKGGGDKVSFTPGGFLQGLKGFDRYEICTGGDCFLAGQEIDVVTFYNAKQGKEASSKYFGYRYNGGNDTLSIFNMINAQPEEKGGYKVGAVAYKFARTVSAPVISKPKQQ
jgi:hypothetical protein